MLQPLSDGERSDVNDFRAQLLRQFARDGALTGASMGSADKVHLCGSLAVGQLLVANPQRFCSSNPLSRPVRELGRFGLQGPISDDELDPDIKAQMLPVASPSASLHFTQPRPQNTSPLVARNVFTPERRCCITDRCCCLLSIRRQARLLCCLKGGREP